MRTERRFRMQPSRLRFALASALIWFCLLILFAGLITPGYSHASQAISELAAPGAPLAWIVRVAGFMPVGLIITLCAFAFSRLPEATRPKLIVSALLSLSGIAITVAGIFPTDPGGQRNSFSGLIHAIAGLALLIVSSLTPFAALFLASQHRSTNFVFVICTALTGFTLMGLFLMMPNAILPGLVELHRKILGEAFASWYQLHGLIQRAFMLIYFGWLGGFMHQHLRDQS